MSKPFRFKCYRCGWWTHNEDFYVAHNLTQCKAPTPPAQTVGTAGVKHDQGKPKLSLLPIEGLTLAAQALEDGMETYGRNNYKQGLAHTRPLDAALRHINKFAAGEDIDSDSGHSHIGHAIASLMMLAYLMKHRPDLDDRGDVK